MKRILVIMPRCGSRSPEIDQRLDTRVAAYAREQREKPGMNMAYS